METNFNSQVNEDHCSSTSNDSWERFMILWGVTPEVLIGSCILTLVSIVATFLVTSNRSNNKLRKQLPEDFDLSTDICPTSDPLDNDDYAINTAPTRELRLIDEYVDDIEFRPPIKTIPVLRRHKSKSALARDNDTFSENSRFKIPTRRNLYKFTSDKLRRTMTDEQLDEENATKRKQLEAIYNLMSDQRELFGVENIRQIEEQMKLYG